MQASRTPTACEAGWLSLGGLAFAYNSQTPTWWPAWCFGRSIFAASVALVETCLMHADEIMSILRERRRTPDLLQTVRLPEAMCPYGPLLL